MTKLPTSDKTYGVIYADPPWRFFNFSAKGEGRNPISHYECMSFDDLAAMPVPQLAAKDCVLLMWASDPLLPMAFKLIETWGFTYKTVGFYWSKLNKKVAGTTYTDRDFFTGLGYWTRANTEQCLLATRGRPKRLAKDVKRLIVAPRREHSRKPEDAYERIERLTSGPYLELFGRTTRPGWDSMGDQVGLFDDGGVETRRRPSD